VAPDRISHPYLPVSQTSRLLSRRNTVDGDGDIDEERSLGW
jgi:hypothetical protein